MRVQLKASLSLCFLIAAGIALVLPVRAHPCCAPEHKVAQSQAAKVDEKKADTLRQIQSLVERVFRFQKITPKINSLVAFADFLWQIDQPYAKNLFLKSWDLVDAETSISAGQRNTATELSRLRGLIITHLSRHDAALALKLSERKPDQTEQLDKIRAAMSALDGGVNPQQAIKLAEQGWNGNVSGSSLTLIAFLQKLRRSEPAAANDFYLRVVERLASQPAIETNDLLTIGTYIYSSPVLTEATDAVTRDRDGLALYMQIGNALVVDITANRPNVPAALVRAYLTAAVNVLTRPERNVTDASLDAAALRLLLAKAQTALPEVVPAITSRLDQLAVPASEVDSARYTKNVQPSVDEEIAKVDDLSGTERDQKLFSLAFGLYRSGDLKRARSLAEKISDLPGRQKVLDALSFAEAAKQLESGAVVKAEALANSLPVSTARATLKVAIASHYSKLPDKARALEAAAIAANDCRRLENDRHKPYLLLALATVLTEVDAATAVTVLKEAVTAFNSTDKLYAEWFDTIQIGFVQREFSLSLKLVDKEVPSCIEKLTRIEPDATMSLLATLTDETLQGDSLVAFSRSIWKREVSNQ
jgi:hypothetical protein